MNGEEIGRCEHFRLIRESAEYRNYLMLEALQAQLEPSLATNEVQPIPAQLSPSEWAEGQWDFLLQIKAEVQGWREKHAELLLEIDKLKRISKDRF